MPEKNKLFYREMQLDGAVDQESRTVPISFSSEKSVKRFDWRRGEYYNECSCTVKKQATENNR